jgi:enoyl-CoA hydratase
MSAGARTDGRRSSGAGLREEMKDGVLLLTLDRPPANALNNGLVAGLRAALDMARGSADVRGVVLTGAGDRFFTAGGDIKESAGLTVDDVAERMRQFHGVLEALDRLDRPVAAAVNGATIGGGVELCLFADYTVSVASARFGFPEINHGVLPAAKGIREAGRVLGLQAARRLLYSGELFDAHTVQKLGLVDDVLDEGRVVEPALEWVQDMAGKGAALFGGIKRALNLGAGASDRSLEEMTVDDVRGYFDSPEARTARSGWLAGRTSTDRVEAESSNSGARGDVGAP